MANKENTITMDKAFHPGETLKEKLEEMQLSVHDFSEKSKVPEGLIVNIINCDVSISSEVAVAFEQVTKIPADMWIRMQHSYDDYFLATRDMMAISGHQTEKVFEHYIKVSKSEHADRIAAKLNAYYDKH